MKSDWKDVNAYVYVLVYEVFEFIYKQKEGICTR